MRHSYVQWVQAKQRVKAVYGCARDMTHDEGIVVAYSDRPQVCIQRPDGSTFWWVADITVPIEDREPAR